jgi:hypothetical protein
MANCSLQPALHERKERFSDCGQLRSIPDEQLIAIARAIRGEFKRRAQERVTRAAFRQCLSDFGEHVPEITPSTNSNQNHRTPRSFRPQDLYAKPHERLPYLRILLSQDWSALWPGCDEVRKYCVYAHVSPAARIIPLPRSLGGLCRMPFYIGKGTLSRAHDLERNQGHGIRIRQLLSEGYPKPQIVSILSCNLSEAQAFELEAKLIYFFGTIYEKSRKGVLLNLDISLRPKFAGTMEAKSKKAFEGRRNDIDLERLDTRPTEVELSIEHSA